MKGLGWGGMFLLVIGVWEGKAVNRALKVEGDPESAFEAPDHPILDANLGTTLTVEAWVLPETKGGERMIVNKEDVYEIALVEGIFKTAIKPAGQGWDWISSETEVPVGQWTHVAITYDGQKTRTFVNGKFRTENLQWQGKLNDSPDTLKVGRRTRGGETHSAFVGLIDEVRISKGIRYVKDFPLPTQAFLPDAETVALYHFDEEQNGEVRDASGFGNHGKLVRKATLVEVDLPNTFLAVSPKQKMSLVWASLKR